MPIREMVGSVLYFLMDFQYPVQHIGIQVEFIVRESHAPRFPQHDLDNCGDYVSVTLSLVPASVGRCGWTSAEPNWDCFPIQLVCCLPTVWSSAVKLVGPRNRLSRIYRLGIELTWNLIYESVLGMYIIMNHTAPFRVTSQKKAYRCKWSQRVVAVAVTTCGTAAHDHRNYACPKKMAAVTDRIVRNTMGIAGYDKSIMLNADCIFT